MQTLHRKLDAVLVQILPYNCSQTDYSFSEDSPQQVSTLYPDAGFTSDPLPSPTIFSLRRPCSQPNTRDVVLCTADAFGAATCGVQINAFIAYIPATIHGHVWDAE